MSTRIQPRPIFQQAMTMLENARCPECARAFDPVQDMEDYCPRQVPLNCSWCARRQMLIHEFRVWQQQDAMAVRAARRPSRDREHHA